MARAMGNNLAATEIDLPAFASIRRENGVVVLGIHAVFATWLKRALWTLPVWVLVGLGTLVSLAGSQIAGESPLSWPFIVCVVIAAAALFVLFMFGVACLIYSNLTGEVILDGEIL